MWRDPAKIRDLAEELLGVEFPGAQVDTGVARRIGEALSAANMVLVIDYSSSFIGDSFAKRLACLKVEAYSINPRFHLLPLVAPGDILLILDDRRLVLIEPIKGDTTGLIFERVSLSPC